MPGFSFFLHIDTEFGKLPYICKITAEFTVFQLLIVHDYVQMDKTVDISNNTFF